MVPAEPANPRGHWEPRAIVELHDAFFVAIGRSWNDPRPLSEEHFAGRAAQEARARIREVIEQDLRSRPLWIVKDPRMCRLMPLWRDELRGGRVDVRYLHLLRSPLSVARSLAKRDAQSHSRSLLLWLRSYLESELATRSLNRSWLSFEGITADGGIRLLTRLSTEHGALDLSEREVRAIVDQTFDRSLVHHLPQADARPEELPWVSRSYDALLELAGDGAEGRVPLSGLDEVRAEIDAVDRLVFGDPFAWENDFHNDRYWLLTQHVAAQRGEIDALREELRAAWRAVAGPGEKLELGPQSPQEAATGPGVDSLGLLSKSLEVSARLEARWRQATDELAATAGERAALRAECEALRQERDAAAGAREIADRERSEATAARDVARRESAADREARDTALREAAAAAQRFESAAAQEAQARAEVSTLRRQVELEAGGRERAEREVAQLLARKSWLLTAPLRWLYRSLRPPGERS